MGGGRSSRPVGAKSRHRATEGPIERSAAIDPCPPERIPATGVAPAMEAADHPMAEVLAPVDVAVLEVPHPAAGGPFLVGGRRAQGARRAADLQIAIVDCPVDDAGHAV